MRSDGVTDDLAASTPKRKDEASARREIILRVVSALVMAPLGAWSVYVGGLPLVLATGACGIIASFEWVRMAGQASEKWVTWALIAVLGVASAAGVTIAWNTQSLEWVAAASLAGCAAGCAIAHFGKASVSSIAFGAIYTSLPFGCFVWLREAAPSGPLLLISVLAIVWTTDTAAYFAGRGFGGPLLSPRDSPNKTWTGAIGAVVCATLAAAAIARAGGGGVAHWLGFGIMLSVVGQLGDLMESRFKRLYGVKDTSGFVPGHGGILDRLDSLMAAAVAAALVLRFLPGLSPGFAMAPPG